MGSPIHQCQRAELLNQPPTVLKYAGTESIYRQALSLQNIDVAEKTDCEFPRRQPIRPLSKITKQSYVHLAKKTLDKRSEEHTSELQSLTKLVCRLLLENKTYP